MLLPLVLMQVTDEMKWDGADFAAFGLMLFAACGAFEIAARTTREPRHRVIAGAVIAAAFLLVWVELAVGIFD